MKLYYTPGACSLAVHIVAREAGFPLDLIKVDLTNHVTETGQNYYEVNPRGYVPVLQFDDGEIHTEVSALLQHLADQAPGSGLAPPAGSKERLQVNQWLGFVASELHKTFAPWLFQPDAAASTKQHVRDRLNRYFAELDRLLATRDYLAGDRFTVADAYAFTVVNWSKTVKIDLAPYPNLSAYLARVAQRPKVREALVAEGMTA